MCQIEESEKRLDKQIQFHSVKLAELRKGDKQVHLCTRTAELEDVPVPRYNKQSKCKELDKGNMHYSIYRHG